MTESKKLPSSDEYRVSSTASDKTIELPELGYRPLRPKGNPLKIGLIGCGGIAPTHLDVYRKAGYDVVALHDRHAERAEKLQAEFYPQATVCPTLDAFFDCEFAIADITPHPEDRVPLVERALRSSRHVLSQKPLAVDLDVAESLVEIADQNDVLLAVNQNGRWAPHVSYARAAIADGLLGHVQSADVSIYWDHNWCAGTVFDQVKHLLLYDFAIHWFDMACCYFGNWQAKRVVANLARTSTQQTVPFLSGQVLVEFEPDPASSDSKPGAIGQASLVFRGDSTRCPLDRTVIVGSRGTLLSCGPNLNEQSVELHLDQGVAKPVLETTWFNDGFDGAISELMVAIEQRRRPVHDGNNNLKTLELCFAAIASAEQNRPVEVGSVRRISDC